MFFITKTSLLIAVTGLLTAGASQADNYAYMGTGSSVTNFGVVDLNTGVFSQCGPMQAELSGLGVGADHNLYGGAFNGNGFYKVDVTDGDLTQIGTSNIAFFLTGSTTTGMYAVGTDSNLYSIDYTTGNATLIGATGVAVSDSGWWGISTNSKDLYFSDNESTLYRLNLSTGAAIKIGTASAGQFGSLLFERRKLYAGSISPLAIYTLNTKTGQSTLVSNLSGTGVANPWGLAPIKQTTIKQKDICSAHTIP